MRSCELIKIYTNFIVYFRIMKRINCKKRERINSLSHMFFRYINIREITILIEIATLMKQSLHLSVEIANEI